MPVSLKGFARSNPFLLLFWLTMQKSKILVLVGPTASGKTAIGIELARLFDGEVLCVDSRTIYKEMAIGTAKPQGEKGQDEPLSIQMLFSEKPIIVEGIPHWGLDLVFPNESFTVANFKQYAEQKIEEILGRGKLPILVGGTGLYISAIIDNLSLTKVTANEELRKELEKLSDEDLLKRLEEKDPFAFETIDTTNRRRVLRALEIIETTGEPLEKSRTKGEERYDALMIGIDVDREILYERINERVDRMIASGLVDEVRQLKDRYGCEGNAMTGIGYRQICAFLNGKMRLREAIDLVKRDSRHYAKRQLTWFKRDARIYWVDSLQSAKQHVECWL